MKPIPALRPWMAAACAAGLSLAATSARADTFSLGLVSGPASFAFDTIGHADPFEDVFTFTVSPGASLAFSAFFNTPYSNWFWIDDLDGRLEQGGTAVGEADAETVTLPPFPRREVTFAAQALGAGDYTLRLAGSPSAVFPMSSTYEGTVTFAAVAAPVPEPAVPALLALGVVGVGLGAGRRRAR